MADPDLSRLVGELRSVAAELYQCAVSWKPEARLVGNVRADDIARLCLHMEELLAAATETATLRADILEIALAVGVAYEPDSGPCAPGPTDEIVRAIKDNRRNAGETHELRGELATLRARVDSLTEALCAVLTDQCMDHANACCANWCGECRREIETKQAAARVLKASRDEG